MTKEFYPHAACTVASGDCFTLGKCLGSCRSLQKKDHEKRIKELEREVSLLKDAIIQLRNRRVP